MDILYTLFPACITDQKGSLFYVTHSEHAIKRLNLKDGKAEYLDNPAEYVPLQWAGVDKLLLNNENLYLFEQDGKRLLEYSLTEKRGRCFDLNSDIFVCGSWAICAVYNQKIWAFPSYENKVIKVNLINGSIEDKEDLCSDINYNFNRRNELFLLHGNEIEIPYKLYSCGCRIGDEIWVFTERKQLVIKCNISRDEYEVLSIPDEIKGCIHAIWKKGIFYILSTEGNVYSWDFLNNRVQQLVDWGVKYPYYSKFVITDKNIWLIPFFGEDIYIVDLETKRKSKYSNYPEDFSYCCTEAERSKYFEYTEDDENYYFAMHCANYLLIIKKENGLGYWVKPTEPTLEKRAEYYIKNHGINFSESTWELKDWIRIPKNKININGRIEETGNQIWMTMRY